MRDSSPSSGLAGAKGLCRASSPAAEGPVSSCPASGRGISPTVIDWSAPGGSNSASGPARTRRMESGDGVPWTSAGTGSLGSVIGAGAWSQADRRPPTRASVAATTRDGGFEDRDAGRLIVGDVGPARTELRCAFHFLCQKCILTLHRGVECQTFFCSGWAQRALRVQFSHFGLLRRASSGKKPTKVLPLSLPSQTRPRRPGTAVLRRLSRQPLPSWKSPMPLRSTPRSPT